MSVTFTKLFTSITESTVWFEPDSTRLVWITMLAMADRKGRVFASVPGLAHRARVTEEQCEAALKCFLSPDTKSRTKDHEGRRIEEIDGGWVLLNHEKYRSIRDEEVIKESKRVYAKKMRAKEKEVEKVEQSRPPSNYVDRVRHNAEAEAEAEADPEADPDPLKKPPKSPKGTSVYDAQIMDLWNKIVDGTPFPKIVGITGKRKKDLDSRLKEPDFVVQFEPAVRYLLTQDWACGRDASRVWIADFDYMVRDGIVRRYFEKSNSNQQIPTQTKKQTYTDIVSDRMQQQHDAEMQKLMEQYR